MKYVNIEWMDDDTTKAQPAFDWERTRKNPLSFFYKKPTRIRRWKHVYRNLFRNFVMSLPNQSDFDV